MSNAKRNSLTAVNTLRSRLQRLVDEYLDEEPTGGPYPYPYIDVCVELGIITEAEANLMHAGIEKGGTGRKWRLKKLTLLPIQFPNISYSDTMKFVSYKLQSMLRDQMAYTDEQVTDDEYACAAMVEEEYFYTGDALNIFTEEQAADLLKSNDARLGKE